MTTPVVSPAFVQAHRANWRYWNTQPTTLKPDVFNDLPDQLPQPGTPAAEAFFAHIPPPEQDLADFLNKHFPTPPR